MRITQSVEVDFCMLFCYLRDASPDSSLCWTPRIESRLNSVTDRAPGRPTNCEYAKLFFRLRLRLRRHLHLHPLLRVVQVSVSGCVLGLFGFDRQPRTEEPSSRERVKYLLMILLRFCVERQHNSFCS